MVGFGAHGPKTLLSVAQTRARALASVAGMAANGERGSVPAMGGDMDENQDQQDKPTEDERRKLPSTIAEARERYEEAGARARALSDRGARLTGALSDRHPYLYASDLAGATVAFAQAGGDFVRRLSKTSRHSRSSTLKPSSSQLSAARDGKRSLWCWAFSSPRRQP